MFAIKCVKFITLHQVWLQSRKNDVLPAIYSFWSAICPAVQ